MPTDHLRLRAVRAEDEAVVQAAHETMAAEGFVFALAYEQDETFAEYVDRVERLRALGVDPVLVTCDDDNVGSATVIERAGGVLEDIVENESGTQTRRYWI